jgi:hypothetical protein
MSTQRQSADTLTYLLSSGWNEYAHTFPWLDSTPWDSITDMWNFSDPNSSHVGLIIGQPYEETWG